MKTLRQRQHTLHLTDCATVTNTDRGETNRGIKHHCYSQRSLKVPLRWFARQRNKELVKPFCLFFKPKNADTMFCIRYSSKNWEQMAKKNTGQCLPTESKVAYKISGNSGKNWKIETNPNLRQTCFQLFINLLCNPFLYELQKKGHWAIEARLNLNKPWSCKYDRKKNWLVWLYCTWFHSGTKWQ